MLGKLLIIVTAVLVVALTACEWKVSNCPAYEGCSHDARIMGDLCGPEDLQMRCELSAPICKDDMVCVECVANKDCPVPGSRCTAQNTCVQCESNDECTDSNLCLANGMCAAAADVAYVGGTGAMDGACTIDQPCQNLDQALKAIPSRRYIRVTGTISDNKETVIDGRPISIYGVSKAQIQRTGAGRLLLVRNLNANVSIYDAEFMGQTGATSEAIKLENDAVLFLLRSKVTANQGRGIVTDGSSLTLAQSTISLNTAGGLSLIGGTFVIVGNVFSANGNSLSNLGAITITTSQNQVNRLEFNSFSRNQVSDGVGSAIQCTVGAAGTFTARNNLLSGNGTLSNMEQIGGTCAHSYSIVRPGTLPSGMGNSSMDPLFQDAVTNNLHLKAGSPALSAADPMSDLSGLTGRDTDGDIRTSPADIGADEVP